MKDLLLGITIGILTMALLYYIFDDITKEDKEITIIQSFNWCIVWVILRVGFLTALGGLLLTILTAFVINPLCKKAIKQKYVDKEEESD